MRKLDLQYGCLHRIKSKISADHGMIVFRGPSVDPDYPDIMSQLVVITDDHASVTNTPEVLTWKERKTTSVSESAGPLPVHFTLIDTRA